jgi:hypothetical protein
LFYDVYFGEVGKPNAVTANNGESLSLHIKMGVYTIRVVSKSAIKTTEFSKVFTVTVVNKPFTSAASSCRQASDVISIYSSKYADIGTDYFPNWGQGQVGYGAKEFDLNGDKMLSILN